jgi:glycosyltransferase involved in cell wall biosynthesis
MAGLIGRLAALWRPSSTKLIYTPHGFGFEADGFAKKALFAAAEHLLHRVPDHILFVSEGEKHLYRAHVGRRGAERDVVVYNFIDQPARAPAAAASGSRRLVYVGRFAYQKGVDLLLEALSELRKEDWSLDLYGEGPDGDRLRLQSGTLGLDDRVRFHPPMTRLPQWPSSMLSSCHRASRGCLTC